MKMVCYSEHLNSFWGKIFNSVTKFYCDWGFSLLIVFWGLHFDGINAFQWGLAVHFLSNYYLTLLKQIVLASENVIEFVLC